MKKFISVLLALVMVLSLCATAWADDPDYSSASAITAAKESASQQSNDLFWYVGANKATDSVYAYLTPAEGTIYEYTYSKDTTTATVKSANTWAEYVKIRGWDNTYTLSSTTTNQLPAYKLVVFGTGAMMDPSYTANTPGYKAYADQIVSFEIRDGVTELSNLNQLFSLLNFNLSLPASVELLKGECFQSSAIRKVYLHDGIDLQWSVFNSCRVAEGELYVSRKTYTNVWQWCFANSGFSKVTFADGYLSILDPDAKTTSSAFQGCSNLVEVVLPDSLKCIGNDAFASCPNLKKVQFNEGLETVKEKAFNGSALESVILPHGVTEIGNLAFLNCNNLYGIFIPETVTHWGNSVFGYSSNIASFPIAYCQNTSVIQLVNNKHGTNDRNIAYAVTDGGIFPAATQFAAGQLATPVKDSYIFEGWYENAQFSGSPVTTAAVGSTYYAKWERTPVYSVDKHTLSFTSSDAQAVTVSYTGTNGSISKVVFDGSSFEATVNGLTVTVAPKAGLPAGTYHDTMYIHTGDNAVFVVTVSATVETALNPGSGSTGNNIGEAKNPYIKDEPKAETPTKVESSKTFDPGVALYAGMALVSAAGMAWTVRKRGE